jgi:hypothetical protein
VIRRYRTEEHLQVKESAFRFFSEEAAPRLRRWEGPRAGHDRRCVRRARKLYASPCNHSFGKPRKLDAGADARAVHLDSDLVADRMEGLAHALSATSWGFSMAHACFKWTHIVQCFGRQ